MSSPSGELIPRASTTAWGGPPGASSACARVLATPPGESASIAASTNSPTLVPRIQATRIDGRDAAGHEALARRGLAGASVGIPMNLRQSFESLSNEAREVLQKDPLSGHILVFLNRRRNHVKLLVWTRGGFTVMNERLEQGTFASLRDSRVLRAWRSSLAGASRPRASQQSALPRILADE